MARPPRSNPNRQSAVNARQGTGMPQRPVLSARTMLALLREQSVPELEARRRLNSDPVLRAELERGSRHERSG